MIVGPASVDDEFRLSTELALAAVMTTANVEWKRKVKNYYEKIEWKFNR